MPSATLAHTRYTANTSRKLAVSSGLFLKLFIIIIIITHTHGQCVTVCDWRHAGAVAFGGSLHVTTRHDTSFLSRRSSNTDSLRAPLATTVGWKSNGGWGFLPRQECRSSSLKNVRNVPVVGPNWSVGLKSTQGLSFQTCRIFAIESSFSFVHE